MLQTHEYVTTTCALLAKQIKQQVMNDGSKKIFSFETCSDISIPSEICLFDLVNSAPDTSVCII